ncbi:MAG: class I SAM-dependent methyltransferase [Chitinophagaceae bacterium]|nr:class I SAM-dependent methyltransferase [Chitinophagaceae bacterium]
MIDYGAGNGLLGLFAKFCGFRKVILIDLSPEFIESAKRLATTTAISVDFFVEGTIDDLEINVTGTPDAIVGTDIIEHIYDLDSFLGVLKKLNSNTVTVFSTASNNKNWLKRRSLMKIQRKDEWIGWEKDNSGIAYPSFRQLRRQIILNELTGLTEEETELLVTATRGLKKEDIITACINFKQSGQTPRPIPHPTNTCDPLTGSWTERLLSFKEYHDLYRSHSFKLRIYKGFYNSTGNTLKDYILALINKCIQYSGKRGICLSPHIILTGA